MKIDWASAAVGAAIAIIIIAIGAAWYIDYQRKKLEEFLRGITIENLIQAGRNSLLPQGGQRLLSRGQEVLSSGQNALEAVQNGFDSFRDRLMSSPIVSNPASYY